MKLSIVIPARNEETRLPSTLQNYADFFGKAYPGECEIIVSVNGSSDRTADVANEIAGACSNVQVIVDPEAIGKGCAVYRGIREASGEWQGFVDADGATEPEEYDRLWKVGQNADGVIASRWAPDAKVVIEQGVLRKLSSRIFNGWAGLILGLRYKDTQCGAKIFSSSVWETILPHTTIQGFAFDADLLYRAAQCGFRIVEEPSVWRDKEGSQVRFFRASINMFLAILAIRFARTRSFRDELGKDL